MKRNPLDWLSERLLEITTIPLIVMMLHVTADVLMKYIFNKPLPGTLEIVSNYYMVLVVFLPLSFIELTRSAVSVELFFMMFPRWLQLTCTVIIMGLSAATFATVAIITFPDAIQSFLTREVVMGPTSVEIWPARFILPISFGLAASICVGHLLRLLLSATARMQLIAHHDVEEVA